MYLQPLCVLFLIFVESWHANAVVTKVEMTGNKAFKILECLYVKHIEICHGTVDIQSFNHCATSSLSPDEQIPPEQMKKNFDAFIAERGSTSNWSDDVLSEMSRRINNDLRLNLASFKSRTKIITAIAAMRGVKEHQYFILYCSVRKVAGHYLHILIAFRDCYESIISLMKQPKGGDKAKITAAKEYSQLQKRFLALSIMGILAEDSKNADNDLTGFLELPITFGLVPIDIVSKTIAKFINTYARFLEDSHSNLRLEEQREPIALEGDVLVSLITKAELTPHDIHLPSTLSDKQYPKASIMFLYILILVVLPVTLSLSLTIYSLRYSSNRSFAIISV